MENDVVSVTEALNMNLEKLWKLVKDRELNMLWSMGSRGVSRDLNTEQQRRA